MTPIPMSYCSVCEKMQPRAGHTCVPKELEPKKREKKDRPPRNDPKN